MASTEIIIHDEKDNVGVVVIEKITPNQDCSCWIMENDGTVTIKSLNDFLLGMFRGVGIKLVDFKVEFGFTNESGKNEIVLADEISPDTCRLWDSVTDKKLDKDRFRKDLGDLIPAYTDVAKRLGILHEQSNVSAVNVTRLSSIKKKK